MAGLDLVGLAPGLAGAKVEEPAVPRAADDLAGALVVDLAGLVGGDQRGHDAVAHLAALVGTAVEEPDEVAVEIEDDDLPPLDGDELAGARRNFIDLCDDVTGHAQTP